MRYITLADYVLLPLFLTIIYAVAHRIRNRWYPPGHPWRAYFLHGLTAKLLGAVFIGLIYQYYYGQGDTLEYFRTAKVLNSAFIDSPAKWLELMLHIPQWYDGEYTQYTYGLPYYIGLSTHIVAAIAAILAIFGFGCYLPTSLLFACVAYTGVWAMFRTFARQYPHITRPIALAILFIPSTFIWGSGIFKDTVCMFGLGWMTYGVFNILVRRQFSVVNVLLTLLAFYLVALIKLYILLAFLPALVIWVLLSYSHRIKNGLLRTTVTVAMLAACVGLFVIASDAYTEELGQFSIESVAETSRITREYIFSSSGDAGSTYSLGDIDPTLGGMLAKAPLAVNVTLFRPYLWEARKPIIFFNALEATLLLIITLRVFFNLGLAKVLRGIASSPNVQFCLIFTLIFAFSVGISAYNFGSLSRYRIPCLPLYGLMLVLLFYRYNPPEKKLLGPI